MSLPQYINEAADTIDAAMFSGDDFIDKENWESMNALIARWQRGLQEIKETHHNDPNPAHPTD